MKPHISFSTIGGGTLEVISGPALIPLEFTTYPKCFPEVTPNLHFCEFKTMLYFHSLFKNFLSARTYLLMLLTW